MGECPACGAPSRSTRLSVTTDRPYRVRRCRACGLAFTVPRPTPDELAAFYQDAYFDNDSRLGYSDYDGGAAENASRTWDDMNAWAPGVGSVPRTLLDIGGATGAFAVRGLDEGWQATVCELGDSARLKAEARGLGAVATLDEAVGPFGLITMFHVLEHVIDPDETLTTVRSLVDPDGMLVIEMPQWFSAGRLVRRSQWAQLKPPEHINFFSRSSLRRALGRTGWQLTYASSTYPRAGQFARSAIRGRNARGLVREVGRLTLGGLGMGGYLRATARPV